jgi:hypothetical protein
MLCFVANRKSSYGATAKNPKNILSLTIPQALPLSTKITPNLLKFAPQTAGLAL